MLDNILRFHTWFFPNGSVSVLFYQGSEVITNEDSLQILSYNASISVTVISSGSYAYGHERRILLPIMLL